MPRYSQRSKPCPACPYLRSTPSGVWAKEDYDMLSKFDEKPGEVPAVSIFLCHEAHPAKETLCQGWLDCHGADNLIGVRLAGFKGELPPDFEIEPSGAEVFTTSAEAREHGLRDLEDPKREARSYIAKVARKQKSTDQGMS